ncbi:MAG: peptide deformylase [Alistipes sp.]|nr:peptide deformylase [Alistipes sp.]
MKRLLFTIFLAMTIVSCKTDFTAQEREVIHAGDREIMYVLSIAEPEDSLQLREVCLPVSERMLQGEDYATLRRRMLATVQDPENEGVGIAAPQVGVLRRMVAVQRFDKEGEPFEFFLNPEIVERIGEKQSGGEGCLSVPEIRGDVERWQKIRLRYHDEQFAEREEIIEGFTAVIFQHELDHLDGRLFIDYIE